MMALPKRVVVFDGYEVLEGDLIGFVTAWAFKKILPTGDVLFRSDKPEIRPNEKYTTDMWRNNFNLQLLEDHPKIKLDDGRIVYGCQVFWMFPEQAEASEGWKKLIKRGK